LDQLVHKVILDLLDHKAILDQQDRRGRKDQQDLKDHKAQLACVGQLEIKDLLVTLALQVT
jgi:hypothetical protein